MGQEDPLEKEIATHSSILAWRIPWTEEPGSLLRGQKELDTTEQLILSLSLLLVISRAGCFPAKCNSAIT